MKILVPLFSAFFIFMFTGCSEEIQNEETQPEVMNPDQTATEESAIAENVVFLSGMYTTSTMLPHSEHSMNRLLDGKEDTYWATMEGAGPDEGIMFYFPSPQYLNYIQLNQPELSTSARIKKVRVYGDGKNLGAFHVQNEVPIRREVSSLFLKFEDVSETQFTFDSSLSYKDYPGDFAHKRFATDKNIAISEVKFFSEEGEVSVRAPVLITAKVSASSTLSPLDAYHVMNLFDSRKEFAWAEGAAGKGIGEKIEINLNKPFHLSGLMLHNGFQRSEKHFTSNARIKKMIITVDGKHEQIIEVDDNQEPQLLKFNNSVIGNAIEVKITEIFPGSVYEDLVISELSLVGKDGRNVLVANGYREDRKVGLINRVKGSVLDSVVDRSIKNVIGSPDIDYDASIILRSDGTFVLYRNERISGREAKELIADGSWEIKELGKDSAKIRIFGKLYRLSQTIDYYKGESSSDYLQIFQDFLTIQNGTIEGERFIETIYY